MEGEERSRSVQGTDPPGGQKNNPKSVESAFTVKLHRRDQKKYCSRCDVRPSKYPSARPVQCPIFHVCRIDWEYTLVWNKFDRSIQRRNIGFYRRRVKSVLATAASQKTRTRRSSGGVRQTGCVSKHKSWAKAERAKRRQAQASGGSETIRLCLSWSFWAAPENSSW